MNTLIAFSSQVAGNYRLPIPRLSEYNSGYIREDRVSAGNAHTNRPQRLFEARFPRGSHGTIDPPAELELYSASIPAHCFSEEGFDSWGWARRAGRRIRTDGGGPRHNDS